MTIASSLAITFIGTSVVIFLSDKFLKTNELRKKNGVHRKRPHKSCDRLSALNLDI